MRETTLHDLMLAGIFAALLWALVHGWGQVRKERLIRCEGYGATAVRLAGQWLCCRCSAPLRECYKGSGREESDGVHDSMTLADLMRRLRGRSRRAAPAA